MRYLWVITVAMMSLGTFLTLGGFIAGMGPVTVVCGVLLVWSAAVKTIVLRIWRKTLLSPAVSTPMTANVQCPPSSGQHP